MYAAPSVIQTAITATLPNFLHDTEKPAYSHA